MLTLDQIVIFIVALLIIVFVLVKINSIDAQLKKIYDRLEQNAEFRDMIRKKEK